MNYIKRKKSILLITFMLIMVLATTTFAHSGRTDANGGHKDNKNVSGLGSYHYHCGGYPAHLHTNGICPYKSTASTATSKPTTTSTTTNTTSNVSSSLVENKEGDEEVVETTTSTLIEKSVIENSQTVENQASDGGLGALALLGGAGYLGYKKFKG